MKEDEMAHLTRRGFLKSASVGGVTIGVLATVPGLSGTIGQADARELEHAAAHGPLVAYVGDPSKEEIHLLVGTRKVVVRDRKLIAQLVRAAR
jgi:hypothetical protein